MIPEMFDDDNMEIENDEVVVQYFDNEHQLYNISIASLIQ